jgi:hypothetical protein
VSTPCQLCGHFSLPLLNFPRSSWTAAECAPRGRLPRQPRHHLLDPHFLNYRGKGLRHVGSLELHFPSDTALFSLPARMTFSKRGYPLVFGLPCGRLWRPPSARWTNKTNERCLEPDVSGELNSGQKLKCSVA